MLHYESRPAGIILAGGSSRRMGKDKALLPYPGDPSETFLEHLVTVLGFCCSEVFVVARDEAQASLFAQVNAQILLDIIPGGAYTGRLVSRKGQRGGEVRKAPARGPTPLHATPASTMSTTQLLRRVLSRGGGGCGARVGTLAVAFGLSRRPLFHLYPKSAGQRAPLARAILITRPSSSPTTRASASSNTRFHTRPAASPRTRPR